MALALPGVVEADHHGMASFRLRGRILATVPDELHIRVLVEEDEIRAAVAGFPAACAEFWWGRRLACVVVDLAAADPGLVRELLVTAWLRRAPRALARQFEAQLLAGPGLDPAGP